MLKPPFILLLQGGRSSTSLFAYADEKKRSMLPVFTNGELAKTFIKGLKVKLSPVVVDDVVKMRYLLNNAVNVAKLKWVLLNPQFDKRLNRLEIKSFISSLKNQRRPKTKKRNRSVS